MPITKKGVGAYAAPKAKKAMKQVMSSTKAPQGMPRRVMRPTGRKR